MTKKQKKMLVRILITAVMLIALHFIPITGIPQLLAYVAAYLVIGYDILRKAGKGILNGRAFDENFLMALATLGAFFLAIWTMLRASPLCCSIRSANSSRVTPSARAGRISPR